ncbi:MAG: universal stress protein [Deltaproteobacteria bacterium]|nr:MAG: universal stress protein [Deltaproteobacteria bacterium]
MIPKIKKILFATDLTENARYAFNYAADIAARYSAGIVILHVMEGLSHDAKSAIIDMLGEKEWEKLSAQHEKDAMDSLVGKISESKLIKSALGRLGRINGDELPSDADDDIEIIVQSGNVVEEIITQSEKNDCGMIVMAYRSRNMLAESIIGGVCRKVLRRSKKPVMLVPMPDRN